MRITYDVPTRFARLMFTVLMVLAWSGGVRPGSSCAADGKADAQPGGASEPPAGAASNSAEALERIGLGFRVIEAARRDVPRETFDIAAVAATVGKDPQAML